MHLRLGFLRTQYTLALLIAVLIALVAVGLYPRSANAQTVPGTPDRGYTSGPFRMHDGEHVTYGMLVPAVRNARSSAQFAILDSAGNRLVSYPPNPGRTFFVDIIYHANPAGGQRGPSLEISHGIGNPNLANGIGNPDLNNGVGNPDFVPAGIDGVLIGMLLPAVQRNGQTADPTFASMQSFNAAGGTMTQSFLNGFVAPGNPD